MYWGGYGYYNTQFAARSVHKKEKNAENFLCIARVRPVHILL